jgi:hypothetical protein
MYICLKIEKGRTCARTLKRGRCVDHRKGTCASNGHVRDTCPKHGTDIYTKAT